MSKASNQLPHVSAAKAVEVAFLALDGVQQCEPGEVLAGITFLCYLMHQQLGLSVSDTFNQSQRRYDIVDTYFKREAQALSDYINGEMR